MKLKKLAEQTIVITGATSGIGLVTARMAAHAGARLVLAARNEEALKALEKELQNGAHQAVGVPCDVASADDVRRVATVARERFGGFDTWVNNAGVSIYGRLDQIPLEDQRRLFETNFWGVVHGSLEALQELRNRGGAIINVGSTVSDRAIPLQGIYSASKHAVKGFTDAFRMEVEEAKLPISITLVKPGAIDTPYTKHARNYMEVEPKNPPPLYAPDTVAEAILHAAVHPQRDIFVGAGGKAISAMGSYLPRLTDKVMEKTLFSMQKTNRPDRRLNEDSLYRAGRDLSERGDGQGYVAESSLYTRASLHPFITSAAVLGLAGAAFLLTPKRTGEMFRTH